MSRPRHHQIVEVHPCAAYDELAEIVRQENISQTMIAKEILRSRQDGYDKLNRIPKAANSLDRICDRTEGKPAVRVMLEQKQVADPQALLLRAMEIIAEHPELKELRPSFCQGLPFLVPKDEHVEPDIVSDCRATDSSFFSGGSA